MLTLWSIFRSPLIMGGNLTRADGWTKSLLTNAEVISVDQHSTDNRPVISTEKIVIWTARPERSKQRMDAYVAVFNISDSPQNVRYSWSDLGLSSPAYMLRDLWEHKNLAAAKGLEVTLSPHASVLYRLKQFMNGQPLANSGVSKER